MRGATFVREAIAAHLTAELPTTLAAARTAWGLDVHYLPPPAVIHATERYALDRYPCIVVTVESVNGFARNGFTTAMDPAYVPRYTAKVFTWVRTPQAAGGEWMTPEFEQTIRLRDDYATVVRATLLGHGDLGNPVIMWDEGSLLEAYSEVTSAKGDRFVAGVSHTFDLQVDETLSFPPLGIVETETLEVDAYGPGTEDITPEETP